MKQYHLITFCLIILLGCEVSTEKKENINQISKVQNLEINFQLPDLDGNIHHSSEWQGKAKLINFWATWCAPCREEMPSLDLLQSDKRLSNLKVFPINVGKEDIFKSKVFFKELNIKNLNIYFDPTVDLANKFSLRGLPTTILINKKGQEFARIIGYVDFNDQKFINWLKNFN